MSIPLPPLSPARDGGPLRLRRPETAEDTERLAAFQTEHMHFPMGFHIREWLRDDHPTADRNGFTIVEEVNTGEIVSAACLLPQTFSYGGVTLPGGRAEAVATRPDYRRKGLVRAQFDVLHAWADSSSPGQLLQIVEGATWLYRDFGYEPALDNYGGMNSGARVVSYPQLVPERAGVTEEPYVLRSATAADLAFVQNLFRHSRRRYGLATVETEAVWQFLLRGGEPGYNRWYELRIITDELGERVGFVVHDPWDCGRVFLYELREGVSWLAVTGPLLRILSTRLAAAAGSDGNFQGVGFCLAPGHPVFAAAPLWLTPGYDRHSSFGVRIADLPRLVRHIAPALTARLAASPCIGHTGELRLNFLRSGLRLVIAKGCVSAVEPWVPAHEGDGDARFVGRRFLPLLFGHRSLEEIIAMDRDCWAAGNDAAVLLNSLFPALPSHPEPLA